MSPKLSLCLALATACLSLTTAGRSAEAVAAIPPKLSLDDFSRFKIVGGLAISPDGKTIAYEISQGNDWVLAFQDWDTGKLQLVKKGANGTTPVWLNQERVLYGYGSSIERSGKEGYYDNLQPYRYGFVFGRYPGDKSDDFLGTYYILPDINRVNARTGTFHVSVHNADYVTKWLADGTGFVRVAVQEDKGGAKTRIIFRNDEMGSWLPAAGLDYSFNKIRAHWLSGDGKLLYLSKATDDGTWGVYAYDLEKQRIKELILSHTTYDILPAGAPTLAPKTREILGFDYVTDKQRTIWFDPQMRDIQAALDQILPNRINTITSLSDDLQRMIILSESDRTPGTYFQFDLGRKQLKPVVPILPWIKAAQMAEARPITYQTSDGVTIHGYLTLPSGREPKNLPLVVLPHAGIWDRDTWKFDLDVQFLANRGYAVLQVNYRGSGGYGQAFQEKSYRQLGHKVQDDITAGTRWVIAQGIADSKRVAIMGHGFGGYSALMGVIQNPQLYCCAISVSGMTDWTVKKKVAPKTNDLFKELLGDPVKDAAELGDISPIRHVDAVSAPLLLVFDNVDDYTAGGYNDFEDFTKALGKAHKRYETLDRHDESTGLMTRKNRVELLSRIETFLTKYMPSDMAGVAAPAPAK